MNRIFGKLLLCVMLGMTGCGTIATPVASRQITTLTPPLPTHTDELATVPLDSLQVGRWQWTSFTTAAETYPPVQLWMDLRKNGTVSGVLSIYPNTPDIPPSALTLIQQNGCNISFKALEDTAFKGVFKFVSETEAAVTVDITGCTVKFYGELTLSEPVRGEFIIQYNEGLTQSFLNPDHIPMTPLERGHKIFSQYCSACHGTYGEGAPGIPSLNTDEVRGYTDEQVLTIIRNGVINTVMPAWGSVLKPDDIQDVLELVRHIEILDSSK